MVFRVAFVVLICLCSASLGNAGGCCTGQNDGKAMPTVKAECTDKNTWLDECKLCEKFSCKLTETKTFYHQGCFNTEEALTAQVTKSTDTYKTGTPAYPNVKCEEDHSGHDHAKKSGASSLSRTLSSPILSMPSIIVGTVLVFVANPF
jgi:hypothetical protein